MSIVLPVVSYSCAILFDANLIFFALFQIISLDELRGDYKNPIDVCNAMNPLVLPEYVIHFIITAMFLISGQWLSLVMNIPLLVYHIQKYRRRPVMSEQGIYDATAILQSKHLLMAIRDVWTKLAFYLVSFIVYLLTLVYILIQNL